MRWVALLALAACFDPAYSDQTRCGAFNECPPGRTCIALMCLTGTPDAGRTPDALEAIDALTGNVSITITKTGATAATSTFTYIAASAPTQCDTSCNGATLTVPIGTIVMITADVATGSFFRGFGAPCVGPQRLCTFTLNGPVTLTPRSDPITNNLMFVTSNNFTFPDGGTGLAAADALCGSAANTAGLAGTYRAVLSDDTTNVIDRLRNGSSTPARGFIRLDGLPVADNVDNLLDVHKLWWPVQFDEFGNTASGYAWNGSNPDGTLIGPGGDCTNWSATTGFGVEVHVGGNLSTAFDEDCGMRRPIICAGIDSTAMPPAPTASTGKMLFVSAENWTPSTGLGQARTICTSEKPTGRPAAVPLIASSTVATQVLQAGQLYVRPDGIAIGTGAEIAAGNLRTGIWVRSDRVYAIAQLVWTGSDDPTHTAVDQSSCDNWSNGGSQGIVGVPATGPEWWVASYEACGIPHPIYCVEP